MLGRLLPMGIFLSLFAGLQAVGARPNIVLILADDLGYGDLRSYNPDGKIPTPNLDRLAREGMRFTDAHSGASVCSPTRYGLLTGLHFPRTQWHRIGTLNNKCMIQSEQLTVAELLKAQDYRTSCFGKWHLGQTWYDKKGNAKGVGWHTDWTRPTANGPNDHGFDVFFGLSGASASPPIAFMQDRLVTEVPTEKGKNGRPKAASLDFDDLMPTITKRVLGYLDQAATQQDTRPFFLYFPMTAVHTPLTPSENFRGKTSASDYGDFVLEVDDAVGRVLRKLEQYNMTGNTLFIFTSDNGSHGRAKDGKGFGPGSVLRKHGHKMNGDWRGVKGDAWEGGHRVPFIAKWSGRIAPGTVCDQLIVLEDMMATCADILNVSLPTESAVYTRSILPYLDGTHTGPPIRDYAVLSTFHGRPVVRRGKWTFMPYLGSGGPYGKPRTPEALPTGGIQGQLYDLTADPGQTQNLWGKHPEIVRELTELYENHLRKGGEDG